MSIELPIRRLLSGRSVDWSLDLEKSHNYLKIDFENEVIILNEMNYLKFYCGREGVHRYHWAKIEHISLQMCGEMD